MKPPVEIEFNIFPTSKPMKKTSLNTVIFSIYVIALSDMAYAGGIPLTSDDPNITTAINSSAAVLDVLSNDDSGISSDNFKEVIAVCDINTVDDMCTTNSYSNITGTVSINGVGNNNNVLFTSNTSNTDVFEFKYVMQNSVNATGSALATAALSFIEVNTLSDTGTNGCDGNECTLREAIDFAVTDMEPSEIKFTRDLTGTIALNSELTITSIDLSVIGPGAGKITLSAGNNHRVLQVSSMSERFYLSGLAVIDGKTFNSDSGAGILVDGATDTQIENVRITNNDSSNLGGGVYVTNAGLTLRNTEISHNVAGSNGGGLAIIGGLGSDVTIENTTISNNQSMNQGDGIYINSNNGQNVNLRYVTAAENVGFAVNNFIGPNGNIIIESSVFTPLLLVQNPNNIINNSIIENYSGSTISGDNNLIETDDLLLTPLYEFNNSGLRVHGFNTDSILYNHVDNMVGNAGCGTQVTADQVGNSRPNEGACDAGAYEYTFSNIIFADDFE